jgi:hypothetical protein
LEKFELRIVYDPEQEYHCPGIQSIRDNFLGEEIEHNSKKQRCTERETIGS